MSANPSSVAPSAAARTSGNTTQPRTNNSANNNNNNKNGRRNNGNGKGTGAGGGNANNRGGGQQRAPPADAASEQTAAAAAAAVERRQAEQRRQDEEDAAAVAAGGETCVVCFKVVEIFSIGECDHAVCYECSTRMRVLCKQNECPICRTDMSKVCWCNSGHSGVHVSNRFVACQLWCNRTKMITRCNAADSPLCRLLS